MTCKPFIIVVLLLFCKVLFARESSNKHNSILSLRELSPRINLLDSVKTIDITAKTAFYIDESNTEKIDDIATKKFLPNNNSEYDFHFTPNTVWIKFEIDSKLRHEDNFVFQIRNWFMDVADLYYQDDKKKFKVLSAGDNIPFSTKEIKSKYPSILLNIKPQTTSIFYLKLKNTQYFNFKLSLIQSIYFFQYQESGNSKDLISGLILMRFAFHLALLFFMFKDIKFRAFSFWGISLCFIYYFSSGYAAYIFPNSPYLTNLVFFVSVSFAPIILTYYIYIVFELKEKLPQIKPLYYAFACVGLVNLAINPFIQHAYITRVYITFMAFFVFFHFVSAIWLYFKISKPSIWYIITLIIYLPTFSFYYARNAGLINYTGQFNIIQLTFFIDFLIIPFIIAAMLKQSNQEKMNLQAFFIKKKIEAEKLQEIDILKTHFFINISHELRTPLTLITAPIQKLLIKYPSDNLLPLMHRNTQRLLTLINQLLDISKLEAGQMKVEKSQNNVSKYFKTLVSSFTSLAESRKIIFQFKQNQQDIWGYIDEDKMDKIIINLLSNAFKFTLEGGNVSVESTFSNDFSNIILTIKDSGIGIPAEKLPKIFDRFYQVDATQNRNYEGTGIGLALVKELVEVLNGKISVESTVGVGTTFTINFPFERQILQEESTEAISYQANSNGFDYNSAQNIENNIVFDDSKPIVLIAEDNLDLRNYIKFILQNEYHVVESFDGQDGIEKAFEVIPDLIISDLMMPRLDGFGVCKAIKEDIRTSHIPVIILTAKAMQQDKNEGLSLGADDYLSKPFDTEELKIRVGNLIKQRVMLRMKYSQVSIVQNAKKEEKLLSMDDLFIQKLYKIIDGNLSVSSFDIEQLCNALAMSRTTMNRKLKALTNQSATEFIRNYRLEKAKILLENRTALVSEIAYQVGFESLSYFTKTFQEKYKILPSEIITE